MRIKTALILCAGFGSRLNPLTLKTPKPLLKLNDKTMLEDPKGSKEYFSAL